MQRVEHTRDKTLGHWPGPQYTPELYDIRRRQLPRWSLMWHFWQGFSRPCVASIWPRAMPGGAKKITRRDSLGAGAHNTTTKSRHSAYRSNWWMRCSIMISLSLYWWLPVSLSLPLSLNIDHSRDNALSLSLCLSFLLSLSNTCSLSFCLSLYPSLVACTFVRMWNCVIAMGGWSSSRPFLVATELYAPTPSINWLYTIWASSS